MKDVDGYLTHGTNKQIFYRIYHDANEIDEAAIIKLLHEAVEIDNGWNNTNKLSLQWNKHSTPVLKGR